MKKTLGYGYKLSRESLNDLQLAYDNWKSLKKTPLQVKRAIKRDKRDCIISERTNPKIFKIVIEIE